MEPITLGDDEYFSAGGIQEKIGEPSLIWILALSRRPFIDPFQLHDPMILWHFNINTNHQLICPLMQMAITDILDMADNNIEVPSTINHSDYNFNKPPVWFKPFISGPWI